MKDLWQTLKETEKPIILYGMGDGAQKVIDALNIYGIKISGVFASDGFVRQKTFAGFPVTDYKTAKETFGEICVLLCFGTALTPVIDNIKRIASENTLYVPDVPVYGGPLFTADYYAQNREKIEKVYALLADETSKKCFKNIIEYKQTGNMDLLFDCQTESREIYENVLNFKSGEVYCDLGAYRGDTVFEFINILPDYKKIIAVEPDKKTFSKLINATENLKNFKAVCAAVSDKCGKVGFFGKSSRGSSIAAGDIIDSVTVDSLSENPTYIKMDVEGAEMAAIDGAREVIKKHAPKMRIAAYHKSADIFELPLKVLSINSDYKVYMRHLPCLPAWDTDYFFIPNK